MDFFDKTTTLYILKNIPLDTTYNHTWYFANKSQQWEHFSKNQYRVATLTQSEYQRYDNGSINVNLPMSRLYTANYLVFVNDNVIDGYLENKRFFYAFITDVEYVNPNSSRIYYEIDYMQTFLEGANNDYQLGDCFVVREHSRTDNIGDNLIPENVKSNNYVTVNEHSTFINETDFGYGLLVVGDAKAFGEVLTGGTKINGVIMGGTGTAMDYYYYSYSSITPEILKSLAGTVNNFVNLGIQVIYIIPQWIITKLANKDFGIEGDRDLKAFVKYKNFNVSEELTQFGLIGNGGFTPKNKKLFTYPYSYYEISDNNGKTIDLKYEFSNIVNNKIYYYIISNIDEKINIGYLPIDYKNEKHAFDEMITFNQFSSIGVAREDFATWLTQKGINTAISIGSFGILKSNFSPTETTSKEQNFTNSVLSKTANNIGQHIANYLEPDNKIVSNNGGLKFCSYLTTEFTIRTKQILPSIAKTIDDYFTMFGYATNAVKKPNLNVRQRFTYTQTEGCVFKKVNLPQKFANKIASIYDKGITFWKPTATIGDYTTDNLPL